MTDENALVEGFRAQLRKHRETFDPAKIRARKAEFDKVSPAERERGIRNIVQNHRAGKINRVEMLEQLKVADGSAAVKIPETPSGPRPR